VSANGNLIAQSGFVSRCNCSNATAVTLKPRAKLPFGLFKRRRTPQADIFALGLAAREVIVARLLLTATGKLTAAEARRMIEEKRAASVRAQFACAEAILRGEAAAARQAYFDVYRSAVESNRKRLGTARTGAPHRWQALVQRLRSIFRQARKRR
jgi:hypothetical protein